MILLDTNVLSELVRPMPEPAVVAYLRRLRPQVMFTAALCEAEIAYGLARMPKGRRRDTLSTRLAALFASFLPGRILPFDRACAADYGAIRGAREGAGKPVTVQDAMIAATARAHGASLATRNVGDFDGCGITLVNPWATA